MKKVLLLMSIAVMQLNLFAQEKDVKKINELLKANNIAGAKAAADQMMAAPKNQKSAEAWYAKAKVFNAIANSPADRASVPDCREQGLEAVKKAMELDKNVAVLSLTTDNFQPVIGLYTSGFELGANLYNEEKYQEALDVFKSTGKVGDYIFGQGWGLYKLDTTLTYYSALSAMNAKKEDEAIQYFTKLAEAKVCCDPGWATSYRWLAKHYYDKKDEANMMKFVKLGMEAYPKDDYLPLLELDYVREKGDKAALFAKYEEILAVNPKNFEVTSDYATELFADTHVGDASKRPADYDKRCAKIESLYKTAIELNPESWETQLSLGKHYYNMMLMHEEEYNKIRGTKPEDVQRKSDLGAKMAALADQAVIPLEKVYTHYDSQGKLKVSEKSNYKSSCSLLSYCYEKKKDKTKADFYQKKYDGADAAH
jgi:tetratricopeptide (TPR) repeat protein